MQLTFSNMIHVPNIQMDLVLVVLSCYFGVLLHHTSHISAQGTTNQPPTNLAFFNSTAQATVNTVLNLQTGIAFRFRTCDGGELLSQTGANDDSINFQVDSSTGAFLVQWSVGGVSDTVTLGNNFNSNLWTQAEVGQDLILTVGDDSITLNSTLNIIDLSGGDLLIGRTYVGCIEEISGLNLASASQHTNVLWGQCPLDSQNGCGAPIIDPCYSIPCQHGGICTNLGDSYLCECTARYNGSQCETDTGPLCQAPTYTKDCQNGGFCKEDATGNYTFCQCPAEYEGELCERPANYCAPMPCQNEGICHTNGANDGYRCECTPGWSGNNCDQNINECGSNPCFNNAQCIDGINNYTCNCTGTGYEGKHCDMDIDECEMYAPCLNGATCTDLTGDYSCNCVPGYEGKNCEVDLDMCLGLPCQNGATCIDLGGDYQCTCTAEWMGKDCTEAYDPCVDLDLCQNNATCVSTPPSPYYTCTCIPGYNGDNCENDIDECIGETCLEGQMCIDLVNGFECRCPVGFDGDRCLNDIDDCATNPCVNGAACQDKIGYYVCNCTFGFNGTNCEIEIDFCDGTCKNGAYCMPTPGPPGYQCFCVPGFSGDNCQISIDECLSNPCLNGATCMDNVQEYECLCAPGFEGVNCQTNIDECASSPCQNNGTCRDETNEYFCDCQPGFNGTNCEIEIDECLSMPCSNGGYCLDLINGYECNCTDTGFKGDSCEINIDDCDPLPCKNGATCMDKVKDYDCNCYLGYDGKDCEIDIDECDSSPCLNGAQCYEMSDPANYQPGFEHRNLFPDEFSYVNASGYVCVCLDGFEGVECETNIDECESGPCANNGTCVDVVNGYRCECASGWEGPNCASEINECDSNPCQNSGTCTDIVDGYTCSCTSEYSGLRCEVLLVACMGNTDCLNGATCVPFYNPTTGNHFFTCTCTAGYTGEFCGVSTAVSFRDGTHIVDSSTNNEQTLSYSFAFATTLPSGLLLYSGDTGDYILLEMFENQLYFSYNDMTVLSGPALEITQLGSSLADGEWHTVELSITDNDITLSVTGVSDANGLTNDCSDGKCTKTISRNSYVAVLDSLYIGGLGSSVGNKYSLTRSGLHYTGCVHDVMNDGKPILLPSLGGTATGDAQTGCARTEQCNPDPCSGNGGCTDLWWTFECECELGYTGPNCSYAFTSGTFSFEETKSHAMFSANAPLTLDENIIRLIFRTREKNGRIFYTSAGTSYITIDLKDGGVIAKADFTGVMQEIVIDSHDYSDARYHTVILERKGSELSLQVDKSTMTMPFVNTSVPDFQDFYLGGDDTNLLPGSDTVPNFKGCITDVKYNNYSLQFFPLNIPGYDIDSLEMTENNNVLEGCVSDDACRADPCEQGGLCEVTWNDFVCDCPNGFGGKNCSEETICARNPCPFGVDCWDRDDGGYDCVTEATFSSDQSLILYRNSINASRQLDTISLRLRTREDKGIILHSNNRQLGFFFTLEVFNGKPRFRFDLGAVTTVTLMLDYDINDGEWHTVEITVGSEQTTGSVDLNYNVTIPHSFQEPLQSTITEPGSSDVYLGDVDFSDNTYFDYYNGFDGCMDEVRIGEILLPFFNEMMYNSTSVENFYATITDVSINCTGDPICDSNPCLNGATCKDLWNEFECECVPGFAGTNCEINIDECADNPCLMGSTCEDGINNFTCRCMPGYDGRLCDIDIDECASDPCLNNATGCKDLVDGFECNCTANYTGRTCEFLVSMTCDDEPCRNGATCNSLFDALPGENAYRCECVPGYEGENCAYEIDYCANHTCQNGATCNSSLEMLDYVCHCMPGYDGRNCENDINECEGVFCQNGGTCTDLINKFECNCVPGYDGDLCESEIDECSSDPCNNGGTCVDMLNGFDCMCQPGYEGNLCELDKNECLSGPCTNNARCENTHGDFTCHCPPDSYNKLCDLTPCAPSPCVNSASCETQPPGTTVCNCTLGYQGPICATASCLGVECQNSGRCTEDAGKTRWECLCPQFFEGELCQWAGPCLNTPCENGGTCDQKLVGDGSFQYTCQCRIGFNGTNCENEINWCDSNPCQQQGSNCTSDRFGFNCTCAPGYGGIVCEIKLPDCASGLCMNGATCKDYDYSYECLCVPGFVGDQCETNFNECGSAPCFNDGRCQDEVDGYMCDCADTGYNGTHCKEDINECLQEICQNGGTCENLPGEYKCECIEGFIGINCQARDPCLEQPCLNEAIGCEPMEYNKTVYLPRCSCKDGYDGLKCEQRTGGSTPVNWLVIGIIIGIVSALILIIIIIAFIIVVKNKRATEGTYSPSRQEITGSRVEMDNVLKLPPEERLI